MTTSDPSQSAGLVPATLPGSAIGLPSGRSIHITTGPHGDRFEVASASGAIELCITLTASGPVISIQGARLEINSSDSVSLACRELTIQTETAMNIASKGSVGIHAAGDFTAKALGNADIDAQLINLNCKDRSEFDDASLTPFELPESESTSNPPPQPGCDCR